MSLDINLVVIKPVSIYSNNITHNLGKMASAVALDRGMNPELTLYDVLWRPDEHGFSRALDITDLLDQAVAIMERDCDRLRELNPANGWGDYDGLVRFVRDYLAACEANPQAVIEICR
jgi:hypothetical protein